MIQDTDDTDPGAQSATPLRHEDSVRTSLSELRRIEEKRTREEEAAECAHREAAERERAAAVAELARKAEAEAAERRRAAAAAAERARLLDVEQRLAEQEQALRAEFEGARARLTEELRATRAAFRRVAIPAVIVGITAVVFAIVLQIRLGRVERERDRVILTLEGAERVTRVIQEQLTAVSQRTAMLDRDLTDARDRASRAEARVLELEQAPPRTRPTRVATKPARPSAPKPIDTDISDDPLGSLADDPLDGHWRP